MNKSKYAKYIDLENRIFEVLELVYVQLPNILIWYSDDYEAKEHNGHIFFGKFDASQKFDNAYIAIIDVTNDPDEPDISKISNDDVAKLNHKFHHVTEKGLADHGFVLIEWLNSHLNNIFNRNILVSAYVTKKPNVGIRVHMIQRMTIKERKIIIESCFNEEDNNELARPIFNASHPIGFL